MSRTSKNKTKNKSNSSFDEKNIFEPDGRDPSKEASNQANSKNQQVGSRKDRYLDYQEKENDVDFSNFPSRKSF